MKKLLIVIIIAVGIIVWWNVPVKLMQTVNAADIDRIEVVGGETGAGFAITDGAEIAEIVTNIQSPKLKREKLSIGYGGGGFVLSFYNKNNRRIAEIGINTKDVIEKSPFFYVDSTNSLCIELLTKIEERIVNEYEDGYVFYPTN